jgi:predicted Fe-Mo cluster-binding NifX family protein
MKTAITSTGETPDSKLDQRFGRCAWFIIYDRETGATEAVANPGREALEGAGPAAVQLVASKGVRQIVSGEFGIKIKSLVDSLGIQMIILKESEKTVREVMDLLKNQ